MESDSIWGVLYDNIRFAEEKWARIEESTLELWRWRTSGNVCNSEQVGGRYYPRVPMRRRDAQLAPCGVRCRTVCITCELKAFSSARFLNNMESEDSLTQKSLWHPGVPQPSEALFSKTVGSFLKRTNSSGWAILTQWDETVLQRFWDGRPRSSKILVWLVFELPVFNSKRF